MMGIFTNLNWCNRRISEPSTGAYPDRSTRIFPTPHGTPTTGGRETLPFVELRNLQLFKLLELFEEGIWIRQTIFNRVFWSTISRVVTPVTHLFLAIDRIITPCITRGPTLYWLVAKDFHCLRLIPDPNWAVFHACIHSGAFSNRGTRIQSHCRMTQYNCLLLVKLDATEWRDGGALTQPGWDKRWFFAIRIFPPRPGVVLDPNPTWSWTGLINGGLQP